MPVITNTTDGVAIKIKAVPGASRTRIVGRLGDELKVQVAAPPEKGKANDAIESLIARALGVNPSKVSVISGMTSPRKVVNVTGVVLEDAQARLGLA